MKVLYLGMAIFLSSCQSKMSKIDIPYHEDDQPIVEKALEIYSGNGRIKNVIERVYPVVVHLPEMVCVGLNLRPGLAGGDSTICFKKSDGRVAVNYVNGE